MTVLLKECPHHTGQEVVAEALRNLSQRVGRQRGDDEAISPAPQLYVHHWVPHHFPLPPLLFIP